MASGSNADYFGEAGAPEEVVPVHRHRSRTRKHRSSKHHRRSDYDSDSSSPIEQVVEEKAYYDPVTGNSTREINKTEYVRSSSRRRHRHRDRSSPDLSDDDATIAASTATAESVKSKRRHRSSRKSRYVDEDEYDAPPQPAYPGEGSTNSSYDKESGYISRSPSPRESRRERRKSVGETALAALGLGGVAEKISEKKEDLREKKEDFKDDVVARTQSRHRSRRHSEERSRRHQYSESESESSPDRESRGSSRTKKSMQAAILAAAVEAYRARKEPGGLTGERGLRRVVEAAVASGALNSFLGRNGDDGHSSRHIIESVIGGLGAQRALNGPRSKSRGGNHTVRDLVASGAIAAGGKKLIDSHERARSASRSSRSRRPGMGRQRSHSAGDILAAVGLGGAAEAARKEYDKYKYGDDRDRRHRDRRDRGGSDDDNDDVDVVIVHNRDDRDDRSDRGARRSRRSRRSVDDYATSTRGPPDTGAVVAAYPAVPVDENGQVVTDSRSDRRSKRGSERGSERGSDRGSSRGGGSGRSNGKPNKQDDGRKHKWKGSDSSGDDDLSDMSSDEERKKINELKRGEFLGIALAVIGSLHAAATIYEGKEKREQRKKELASGKISPAEAAKMRTKHQMRDVVSVGLATLGATEAYKSWKEMAENRKELREFKGKCDERHKKRKSRSASVGGPQVQQYIMPAPVVPVQVSGQATAAYPGGVIPPAGTYPNYAGVNGTTAAQQAAYTTRDGRAVPVVYPSSVRDV